MHVREKHTRHSFLSVLICLTTFLLRSRGSACCHSDKTRKRALGAISQGERNFFDCAVRSIFEKVLGMFQQYVRSKFPKSYSRCSFDCLFYCMPLDPEISGNLRQWDRGCHFKVMNNSRKDVAQIVSHLFFPCQIDIYLRVFNIFEAFRLFAITYL